MKPRIVALVLAGALAACGGGDPVAQFTQSSTPTPTPTSTGASATPSASPSPTPSRSVVPTATLRRTDLSDGAHPGYLKALDTTKLTLTVDVVQFLTGQAAEKAAKEDGEEAFDYYIRNQNKQLRTLPVAADVAVITNVLTAEKTGDSSKDTQITLAELKGYFANGRAQQALFNLTLTGGVVVKIHEQYLP